jgi:hypothetical protein
VSLGHAAELPEQFSGLSQPPAAAARHTVLEGRKASVGHIAELPVQLSATSHPPEAAARHTVLEGRKASVGQVAAPPVQLSATSHPPATAGRQTVLDGAKESAGHAFDAPSQVSAASQPPAAAGRHTVAAPSFSSAGQSGEKPSQDSAASHGPAAARHMSDDPRNASAGQIVALPVQFSAGSQTPVDARHSVDDEAGAQLSVPSSQPATQPAIGQGSAPVRQAPAPSQVSSPLQNEPSAQDAPAGNALQFHGSTADWHDWHEMMHHPAAGSQLAAPPLHTSQASRQRAPLPAQAPEAHWSVTVHQSASSQGVSSGWLTGPQVPVPGSHMFERQAVSPAGSQVTRVAGSTTHSSPSQISVPLHRLPSSWTAHSVVSWHSQRLGPETQVPSALQVSFSVQGLPSSHATAPTMTLEQSRPRATVWHVSSVH